MKYMTDASGAYEIKRAGEPDFPGVIDCIRHVNGELFYNRNMYSLEYLCRESKKDNILVFAAINSNRETVGTISVTRNDFDLTARTMSAFMVWPELRGSGIGSALQNYAVEYAKGAGRTSLGSFQLTTHTGSQHIAEKLGFVPTGFLFGISDERKVLPDPAVRSQKRALATYMLTVNKTDAGTVYVPGWLTDFTRHIYDELGATCAVCTSSDDSALESDLRDYFDPFHCVTHIRIKRCGKDLPELLAPLEVHDDPIHTITMYLDVSNPSAVFGLETMLRRGYMFSGFYPLAEDGEYVTLFFRGKATIYSDEIQTTPRSSEVLNFLLEKAGI